MIRADGPLATGAMTSTLVFAHLAGLLEPLAFLPAFLAVIVAILRSRRPDGGPTRDHSTGEP